MSGSFAEAAPPAADGPLARRARLRAALPLVEQMAREPVTPDETPEAAEARARAYAAAAPIARRRFDVLVEEASVAAAAGIEALIRHRAATGRDCAPAAEELAAMIRRTLTTLHRLTPIG